MSFLDYLDDFDERAKKVTKKIVKEEVEDVQERITNEDISTELKKKAKVLALNVEVCTVKGAQIVIEKLQDWISKQEGINETVVETKKEPYRIPPKKVVKNPLVETRSRAMDILDGLPDDETSINPELLPEHNSQNINKNKQQSNISSVAGHASSLL